ncbi:hypothetical protein Syun_012330 [Stephania yunnanensis]|uniref:Secreted protein n=1 Tax=Stephania yunnanensis TaxID=152371 RepID=A0AAP0PIW8_9MAGN
MIPFLIPLSSLSFSLLSLTNLPSQTSPSSQFIFWHYAFAVAVQEDISTKSEAPEQREFSISEFLIVVAIRQLIATEQFR